MKKKLKTKELDRVLSKHKSYCTFYVYSGDRHCSCGRDKAIIELNELMKLLESYILT